MLLVVQLVSQVPREDTPKRLIERVGKLKDEIVRLTCSLVKEKTVNPPGNEFLAARIVKEFAKKQALKYEVYEKEKGRENVLVSYGEGEKTLVYVTHLDVVPAGHGWKTDPFNPVVQNGKIYGRGALDDKGPLASALIGLKALKDEKVELNGTLIIAALADEEKGGELGVKYLLEEVGFKPDYAVIVEATGGDAIEIAEKGVLWLKLTSKGKQAHGSSPELGVNAILNMCRVLLALEKLKLEYKPHPLLSPPTISVGVIRGGEAVNIVPALCESYVDIRYLPSQTPKAIIKQVKAIIENIARENPTVNIDVEVKVDIPPTELNPDHPLVKAIEKAVETSKEVKPRLIGISGATDAKHFLLKGIPACVYGPGDPSIAHIADEYVKISELTDAAKVLALTAVNVLGEKA